MKQIIAILLSISLSYAGESPPVEQKAVIIYTGSLFARDNEQAINQPLREGWVIKSTTANRRVILVVFERIAPIPTE